MNIDELNEELRQAIAEDYLYEFASIAKGDNNFIAVNPDPSRGWYKKEYFKAYNNDNARKADKVIRIKFRTPEYVYHKNKDGKKDWSLNSKEKKLLIRLLKSKSRVPNLTNWQYAIIQFNTEAFLNENPEIFKTLTIAEQSKMDKNDPRKYYLPIDLPMPDYNQL